MKYIRDILEEGVRPSVNPFRRSTEVSKALAALTLDNHPLVIDVAGWPYDSEGLVTSLSEADETPRIVVHTTLGFMGKRALSEAQLQVGELINIRTVTDK